MSLVRESGREQLGTARSAPDPEPIREDNADTNCVHCGRGICKQESWLHRLMRLHAAYRSKLEHGIHTDTAQVLSEEDAQSAWKVFRELISLKQTTFNQILDSYSAQK